MADGQGSRSRRCLALLWKRVDFRESSRVVSLVTRDLGRVTALAKGAHRPDSPFLGRLDFLNEVYATLSPDRGGLRLLLRVELVHERRALRSPARFQAASHVCDLADTSLFAGRPEPELFDLLRGGLTLIELAPEPTLPQVVLGLELRYLAQLGALPDLSACGQCGTQLTGIVYTGDDGGLCCRRHAGTGHHAIAPAALAWLRHLSTLPGRQWPELDPGGLTAAAVALPAVWLQRALDRHSRLRAQVFTRHRRLEQSMVEKHA